MGVHDHRAAVPLDRGHGPGGSPARTAGRFEVDDRPRQEQFPHAARVGKEGAHGAVPEAAHRGEPVGTRDEERTLQAPEEAPLPGHRTRAHGNSPPVSDASGPLVRGYRGPAAPARNGSKGLAPHASYFFFRGGDGECRLTLLPSPKKQPQPAGG